MAHKVEFWSPEQGIRKNSEREYGEVQVQGVELGDDPRWDRPIPRTLTLYLDEETGLAVQDVAKFEQWIAGKQ